MTSRGRGWLPALSFVACLHLLTTPGTWIVSDHAELLHMARRLAGSGTLTLAPAGEPLPHLPWVRTAPDRPTRSRLFPGTAIVFAPVVFVERLLGWNDAADFGPLTRLGNHLLIWGALALLATTVRRAGASPQAASMMVVLVGTAWPTLQISRHAGAEPLLAFLVAVFLWADAIERRFAQAAVCLALPWVHPTGALLALALALFAAGRRRLRLSLLLLAGSSVLSVALLWNVLYHGALVGGYSSSSFFANPPLRVVEYYIRESLLFVPVIVLLGLAGGLAAGRRWFEVLGLPLLVLALHLALVAVFSTSSGQEPARRLATTWFVWGFCIGRTWDRLGLSPGAARGLLAMSTLLGIYWFELREWNYYPAGDGSYYPLVLWVTLAVEHRPAWQYLVPTSLLALLALAAAVRVWRELGRGASSASA